MSGYTLIVGLHVALGAVALGLFWVAATLRKGSGGHVAVGRAYLVTMAGVLATAVLLAIAAFARDAWITGTFLFYLVLITGSAGWTGWRAVRDRTSVARYVGPTFRALAWTNLIAGLVVLGLGLKVGHPLLIGLSVVGLISGPAMLRFARRAAHERGWWLAQHYGGIIGAGVATHVAFLGIGFSRWVPPSWTGLSQALAWVLPLSVSIIARLWLARRYRPAVDRRVAAAHPASESHV
jgi:hypothetical protein